MTAWLWRAAERVLGRWATGGGEAGATGAEEAHRPGIGERSVRWLRRSGRPSRLSGGPSRRPPEH